MTVCATCSRELQPEWKYCIYCGTPTGVPLTAAIDIIAPEELPQEAVEPAPQEPAEQAPAEHASAEQASAEQASARHDSAEHDDDLPEGFEDEELPEYDDTDTGVLRIEDIPADEPVVAAPAAAAAPEPKVNVLAVLALILGCLVSPLAAVFGHIALSQIGRTGERGTAIAWVAIVLGYLSLAALLVLGISYFVLNS